MPRVLLLTAFDPRTAARDALRGKHGGVERYVRAIATGIRSHGFDACVVGSSDRRGSFVESGVAYRLLPRLGVPGGAPLFPWPVPFVGEAFDLVHVQATYPFLTDLAPLLARLRGVPAVATCHFDVVGRARPEAGLSRLYYRLLGAPGYRAYDRVIYSTRAYADASRSAPWVSPERTRIIPMGVDPSQFRPLPDAVRARHALFVGRLAWFKGVRVLLDAFEGRLRREGWRLTIVGDGPERSAVESRIARSDGRARLLTDVSDDELVRLYNEATVTVLPSIAPQESFGMTLLESLACGTPVVASRWPGVSEVAGIRGVTVEPGDGRALADAIAEVGAWELSAADRRALAERVASEYSWDVIASKTVAVYRELL